MPAENGNELEHNVVRGAKRIERAQHERQSVLAQTVFLGTLGLVFVLPVVAGAYLGSWLDGMASGYSLRWTLSLIVLGVVVGGFNVYLMIRE